MSQSHSQSGRQFAALSYELVTGAGGVATEVHLLPPGPFRSTDMRPVECVAWQLDATIAARLIARMSARRTDTLIDYEHQSLRAVDNGQKVIAAGWIPNQLEWREGKGLYAVNVAWVADAKAEIAALKYRYSSSVFYYDGETGEVLDIVSVALTNTPAIDGLDALAQAAMSRREDFLTIGANQMATPEQLAALTAERDAAKQKLEALTTENTGMKTQLAALTAENTELKGKVTAVEAEKAQAALAADKAKHAELLLAALTDGRVLPAQKTWAEKLSLAALTEFLEASKPLAMLNKQANGKEGAGEHGLSADELAMCSTMRVSPEEFAKQKAKTARH